MANKLAIVLLCAAVLIGSLQVNQAKEAGSQSNQPLGALDKVLKQASTIRMDSVVDNKLASNMTNTLNEMAMNLRKMFMENRRLSSQVQEVMTRVQNVSGINATNTISNLQQQAPNITSLANMANSMNLTNTLARFQPLSSDG